MNLPVKSQAVSCVTSNARKAGAVQGTVRPQNREDVIKGYYDQLSAISYGLSLPMWNMTADRLLFSTAVAVLLSAHHLLPIIQKEIHSH